jgi:protein-L-isoaspartate(D-aspartate) O-methyltransferase
MSTPLPILRLGVLFLAFTFLVGAASGGRFDTERRRMVEEIRTMSSSVASRSETPEISEQVLEALGSVPRHLFVPKRFRKAAYYNRPLPIAAGQTISQPYIVALMTELAGVERGDDVLEVGTGSGYQAAVLAALGIRVHTIEIIPELGEQAAELFDRLGLTEISTRIGDGYNGWEDAAPFDGIIVTAAAPHIPLPLVAQLKTGSHMVIPVDNSSGHQELLVITKNADGTFDERRVAAVQFVPLTRQK